MKQQKVWCTCKGRNYLHTSINTINGYISNKLVRGKVTFASCKLSKRSHGWMEGEKSDKITFTDGQRAMIFWDPKLVLLIPEEKISFRMDTK